MRWVVVAGGSIALLAAACFVACVGSDPESVEPSEDAAGEAGADDAGPAAERCRDGAAIDLLGCPCGTAGEERSCFAGSPGPNSGCTAGKQTCAQGVWSACVGAGLPRAEVCFDDLDNDCNGVLDDQCTCSGTVDLCPRGPGTTARIFAQPSTVGPGGSFQIVFLTKTPGAPEQVQRVHPDAGPFCLPSGVGASFPCAVGPDCADAGWYGRRMARTAGSGEFTATGAYTLELKAAQICTGATLDTASLTITP